MTLGDLRTSSQDGIVTARVTGEIDMSNAEAIRSAITDAMPNEAFGLAVDLSEVDYLDSAGIYLLYRLRESLRARGQSMRLVIPQASPVTDALRLAGVAAHLEAVETVEEAVEALRPRGPSAN